MKTIIVLLKFKKATFCTSFLLKIISGFRNTIKKAICDFNHSCETMNVFDIVLTHE